MVRTILSCIALFGSLIAVVALLRQTSRPDVLHDRPIRARTGETLEGTSRADGEPRLAALPEKVSLLAVPGEEKFSSSQASDIRLVAFDEDTDTTDAEAKTTDTPSGDVPRIKVGGADDSSESQPSEKSESEPAD